MWPRIALGVVAVALAAVSRPARAHSLGSSSLTIEVDRAGALTGTWRMALRDLDASLGLDGDQDRRIEDR